MKIGVIAPQAVNFCPALFGSGGHWIGHAAGGRQKIVSKLLTHKIQNRKTVQRHGMFKLGFSLDYGHWRYMMDGDSDPLSYWRKWEDISISLGFFTIVFNTVHFIIEETPGEPRYVAAPLDKS